MPSSTPGSGPEATDAPPTLTDARLRQAPPRAALARLGALLQPGGRVGTIRRLRGGISSGMHAVELVGPDGERRWVVVRRYGAARLREDPRIAEEEWATLTALARVGAPTPRPLWLDHDGGVFGCPTLVTSRVAGRGLLTPRDQDAWIRQLAEALGRIHAAPLTETELAALHDQRDDLVRLLERPEPPQRLAKAPGGAEVWGTMKRWWPRITPSAPTIVHGDYWPGNTLWRYGRLSGVIDWEQVRRGDPAQDVACCRQDLTLLIGPPAAETFLRAYEASTGRTLRHLFFWDLYMICWSLSEVASWVAGYHDLGRTDLTLNEVRDRLERFVADTLARAARASADP